MPKAIVAVDFAYKSCKRAGRGTGREGLSATLKYLQYRDQPNNHLAQDKAYERWQDRGLGRHYGEIFKRCEALQSRHVLAWTWVISPDPALMALVPEDDRRALMYTLTDLVVEDYYTERGLDVPEYSFVMHCATAKAKDGEPALDHLHTHVVLPGTAPSIAGRLPVYNNTSKGHDKLFRQVTSRDFAALLDAQIGREWRRLRQDPEPVRESDTSLDLGDLTL